MKEITELLREYQIKNNFTQHEMANLLGIAQPTYNNWINRKSKINPSKYFNRIADLCSVDIDSILSSNINAVKNKRNLDYDSLLKALEYCQKFSEKLEEMNAFLIKENEHLKIDLAEKEMLIQSD